MNVAIIGAGPFGLSLAAYLRKSGMSFRIFGTPMESWSKRMPKGMMLKSEGFASDLFDPEQAYPLREYCREHNVPYEDIGLPVTIELFVAYGLEFQKRLVPNLEQVDIASVRRDNGIFVLTTATGEVVHADQVIVAAGISKFAYTPEIFKNIPQQYVTHSSEHSDLKKFLGRRVAVVGAGASAVDIAALLHQAGATVQLIARRQQISLPYQNARASKLSAEDQKPAIWSRIGMAFEILHGCA